MHLAYVAGILDGEGCIGFSKTRKSIYPRVFVTNTNLNLLQDLQHKFGGDIKPLSKRKKGWKQGYSWRISWTTAVNFLDKIYPHLRIKKRQAETIFAWDCIRLGRGNKANKDHMEAIELLKERITWLNKKGPVTSSDPIEKYL